MTAFEFMNRAYKFQACIESKLEQIAVLRSLTQKVTAALDGETVSHTRNVTSLQDSIIRLMEAEDELQQEIDQLLNVKAEISAMIAKLDSPDYRLVLEMRYLSLKTWEEISSDLHFSLRWTKSLHARALKAVDQLISEGGEQT